MKPSNLQQQFLSTFLDREVITTREIYEWYCEVKSNPENLAYRSAIHSLIINPLMHKGLLLKLSGGIYQINTEAVSEVSEAPASFKEVKVSSEDMTNEELTDDEAFERYIQQKLKQGE